MTATPGACGARSLFRLLCLQFVPGVARLAGQDCGPLDDPLQVVDLRLEMAPADWDVVRRDTTFEIEKPAMFTACGDGPITVNVRRKRGGALPSESDPVKVSLKIDFDDHVPDGEWRGHRKLSLESGIRIADGVSVVKEGLAWQLMARAGLIAGGSSWVRVHLNDQILGVCVRIEEPDKSFLRRHLGEDDYFLYKIEWDSGPENFRRRLTRVGEPDPYEADLCYRPFQALCEVPADGYARLGESLDLHQLFTLGAVNALVANFDGLLAVENNFFWYNSPRPRLYFPWDLDLVFWPDYQADPHADAKPGWYQRRLFADPDLRAYFDEILRRLAGDAFHPRALDLFFEDLGREVGPAIDADPHNELKGSFAEEVESVRAWLETRYAAMEPYLPHGELPPVVINEILVANTGVSTDEAGDTADWVELHNRGAASVSLAGLHLSDDPAQPLKWELPDMVLAPGGRVLVWCDGETHEGQLHASFELKASGESVGLYRFRGTFQETLDFVRFGPQEPDVSLGRAPDGSPGFRRLECPTPGAPNPEVCEAPAARFIRGDANADGRVDIADPIASLAGLFQGAALSCHDAADATDDGRLDLTDAVRVLLHLFQGGAAPPSPFPECGGDPTPEELDCLAAKACP